MATSTARGSAHTGDRTPAQWYALLVGGVLVLIGLLGFIAEPSFATGDDLDRGSLLGFDVNGWHNLVHLATGAFLLAFSGSAPAARTAVFVFAGLYAVVTIWGFIADDAILGLIPINMPDNILHLALAAVAFAAALASPTDVGRGPGGTERGDRDLTTGTDADPQQDPAPRITDTQGVTGAAGGRFNREDDSTMSPTGNQGDRPTRGT
jgi:hypothetical protein